MLRICCALVALVFLSTAVEARPYKRSHRGLPWCGIYMTQYKHINKRSLWMARNWAYEGTNAFGPSVGVIVVWRHHVGVITGRDTSGQWIVHSGNDGGRIRTRARSVAGAIAFRHV